MASPKQTFTFFGATGGCTANALALSLKAEYHCTAMVRTPEKLRDLLVKEHFIPPADLDTYLTITQGNITDEAAVKAALTTGGHLPDKIMYGIGAAPQFHKSLTHPVTIDQPTICGDGMAVLVSALRALQREGTALPPSGKRPCIAVVSTTGISKGRDVPLLMVPMYKFLLHTPHIDKKNMEESLLKAAYEEGGPIGAFTIVKPTLLTDGPAKQLEKVRAGWTWPDGRPGRAHEAGPETGYTISRASVGLWVFERVLKGGEEWQGRCVSLA